MGAPFWLHGQTPTAPQKIVGRVLAETTGLPLAFAHLSVGGNEIGTLSNEQGVFILKVPERFHQDTLLASYLGYLPQKFPIQRLGPDTLFIRLTPSDVELDTVVIRSITAIDTLRKSWRIRGENFETRPTLLQGYYREELVDIDAQTPFLFAEGVLELYKSPYDKKAQDRVRVLKGRQKQLPNAYVQEGRTYLVPNLTEGPYLGLFLDVMKEQASFVQRKNHKLYRYAFKEMQSVNGQWAYVFSFAPKDSLKPFAIFRGEIYVDVNSLAVVHASYRVTRAGIRLYNREADQLRLVSRNFEVNYMEYQGKWYLQDAFATSRYTYPAVNRNLQSSLTFVTTEIINDKIDTFPKREALKVNQAFVETVEVLEEEFWEEYNVVPVAENE